MKTDEEITQALEAAIRKGNELIETADAHLAKSESYLQQMGFEPNAAEKALNDPSVPAVERENARREIAEFEEELRRDREEAVRNYKLENGASAPIARVPFNRVRI